MKIVRFSQNGHSPRLGCYMGQDRVVDLEASCADWLFSKGVVRAAAIAAALFPQSTRGFLEGGTATQEVLGAMVEATKAGKFQPVSHASNAVRLHAPINDPGKFICIGLNYKDHAAETGSAIPKEPPVFPKWNNAILDPGEPILRPRGEKTLDWEVELGVVIGKTARFVPKERALDYIYGYTIINDASARDFQFHTSQWGPGKMGDTLAPVGPYIADRSEIPDPHVLSVKTWVNGTLMQDGNTKNFIFDLGYIIQYLTNIMTLSPGDLISTGTPAGVGFSRKPPITLQPGDVCKLEITGLGTLENPVKDA
ncbi:MAG TPA: fumarylacetoacetate hydrolase family protein [Candidatus Acidoferrales bacterium]|nr:fumarylacetoacetate hydrolase family protein [Candidatus Acidoferrales bacterium]